MGVSVLICLFCSILCGTSCGQQYGHHNMPGAGAGVNPKPYVPLDGPAGGPVTAPVHPSLPADPIDKPSGALQPPPTRMHPTMLPQTTQTSQHNTETAYVPVQPQQSTARPLTTSPRPATLPSHPRSCYPDPCQNKGSCEYNEQSRRPQCKCRQLYLGDYCEVVVSPPNNISMTQLTPESVQISWQAPPRTKEIAGFVVQYNKFGEDDVAFSQLIHPSVTQFTLRDLEPGQQYTICISIVFHNVSISKEALLRDQCREIKTKPLSLSERGISVPAMGAIIGCVILFLCIIMITALVLQRKCLKKNAIPMRVLGNGAAAQSRANKDTRVQHSRNTNAMTSEEYDTAKVRPRVMDDIEVFRPIKPNTNPFLGPTPIHACTNNANMNEPYYGNLLHATDSHVIMLTQQTCLSHGSCAPPDVTETKTTTSANMLSCSPNRRLQRTGSVPPANIRALPITISNHVMRSANARDMDASGEFDLHRTYFFPKF